MTWTYNNAEFTDIPNELDSIGFVYMITNTINGKRYIGKKSLYSTTTKTRTVTLKTTGEKKRKKFKAKTESNWRDYYGSSEEIQKDIEVFGKEAFKREILRFCGSKGELSYYEAKYQFDYDVLLNPKEWYNGWISVKVHRAHLKTLSV